MAESNKEAKIAYWEQEQKDALQVNYKILREVF